MKNKVNIKERTVVDKVPKPVEQQLSASVIKPMTKEDMVNQLLSQRR